MEQELSKLTKKELLDFVSKFPKKHIIKMVVSKHGGLIKTEKEYNKNQNKKVNNENNSSVEIITENIKFNPNVVMNKNNIMKNNKIYNQITDY